VKQALLLLVDLVSIPVALFIATTLRYGTLRDSAPANCWSVPTVLVSRGVPASGLYRAIVRFAGHEAIVAIVKGRVDLGADAGAVPAADARRGAALAPMIYWCLMLICVGLAPAAALLVPASPPAQRPSHRHLRRGSAAGSC
jgi:FlaA1/EpsC-like NDP-sugar epimerase